MQLDYGHVLLPRGLLRLDQASRVVYARDQAPSDLRVEGPAVPGLVDLEDPLDPGDHLVGGGVRGLVEVDHTVALQLEHRARGRGPAAGEGREVGCLDIQLVEILRKGVVRQRLIEGLVGEGAHGVSRRLESLWVRETKQQSLIPI